MTAAPFQALWDTTKVANGPHVLSAVARDSAGLQTTSEAITVEVANSAAARGCGCSSRGGAWEALGLLALLALARPRRSRAY